MLRNQMETLTRNQSIDSGQKKTVDVNIVYIYEGENAF